MSKKAILCVDDEKVVLTGLKSQLKKLFGNEYIYEFAENPIEAFEIIEELRKDDIKIVIIVSDWLMPEMKGDEFLISVHRKYPETVKILLTGQADKFAIERTIDDAQLHSCIYKPWSEDDLFDKLTSGLKKLDV